ncbi:predicted protein [Naegleria gruberi]|uniref:Predicted protein n=1 Tax=Naegleria gruberi TaxID=5762 RepID=D2V780_NAEGR|nr:uncharacterized protein NAEGRDRAFT_64701 [Naegleria gruberi]EFC47210.1 predicted protein [Naegleria gruberi]|eukprot:XP_002679954.1 predicted protein [Naegleria gruberi strain NEG-M]
MSESESLNSITTNDDQQQIVVTEEGKSEINEEIETLGEGENNRPSPLIPKELVFDSKLIQYISEYRDEIKMKPRCDLLECEAKSLEVLINDQGFKYVTRKMMGKEHLEEAFFIEFLESYCLDYYNFINTGEELNHDEEEIQTPEEDTSSSTTKVQSNVVIEELTNTEDLKQNE